MDLTIPAPQGSTDTAASQVTAQDVQTTTPQAETPAGQQPQAKEPAGAQDQTASDQTDQSQDDDKPKTWKEKRQERNRQRWQEYKEAKAVIPQRLAMLEGEVARLRQTSPPDFSQIVDPTEELAERTAWKVRQSQAEDTEKRLTQERERAALEDQQRMKDAWSEAVEDARDRMPDFDQVVTKDTPIHARAAPYIVESDLGAEIAYWLGKNPNEARALFNKFESAPNQALIELGRIEARLSAPEPQRVSTAPRPAQTLSGGANPLAFDPGRASTDDMAAQLRKAGIIR